MDIRRAIRSAVSTGKVHLGASQTQKSMTKGNSKMIIIANNCPSDVQKAISEIGNVPVYNFEGTNIELGSACGKPFSVAVMSIENPGESDILVLQKESAPEKKPTAKAGAKKKAAK
jgi:large subunit ribosomal protein L30e